MTLVAITTLQVLKLTKVLVAAGGVKEDLDVEGEVVEADVVVRWGGMELLPMIRLTHEPISPSPIILRTSTAGLVLQKSTQFFQEKGKQPRSAAENTGDTSSIKELNFHIRHLYDVIKIQNKSIHYIKTNNSNKNPLDLCDEKYVLHPPHRENPSLGRHGKGSAKRKNGGG